MVKRSLTIDGSTTTMGTEGAVAIQIIGTMKCKETKKCRLWFDQRGKAYQFIDLSKRSLSPGELDSIASKHRWDDLIDRDSKAWSRKQLAWKDYDPREELLSDILLLRTPIVRRGRESILGANPGAWAMMLAEEEGA